MHLDYVTKGTCSRLISLDINDGIISNVSFMGGCSGNLQGIPRLVEGMHALDIEAKVAGVNCNGRGTSCPDQLAKACRAAYEQEQKEKEK